MLRAEVSYTTEVRHSGATGGPRLIVQIQSEGQAGGPVLTGRLELTGIGARDADQIQNELLRRLGHRATFCLGPLVAGSLLDNTSIADPLKRLCMAYGWNAWDLANKAGVSDVTARRALEGARISKPTREKLLALAMRVTTQPTPGETIRRYRGNRPTRVIAEVCDVSERTIEAWEADRRPVPRELRPALRAELNLPPGTWPDEPHLALDMLPRDPAEPARRAG